MHRIDGPGATVDNKFTDGDPVGGVPATLVTDDWLNDVQENIMALLVAAGVAPTKGRAADLLDSIRVATPGRLLNIQVFDLAGAATYTKTPGATFAIADVQGAGGQGGGSPATSAGQVGFGSGGHSGSRIVAKFSLIGVSTLAVTVGAGGTSGVAGASGQGGGTSSLGSLITAPGGSGGNPLGPSTGSFFGGNSNALPSGTTTATLLISQSGNSGFPALIVSGQAFLSGGGGPSPGYSGSSSGGSSGTSTGNVGIQFGQGGGGAFTAASGAAQQGGIGQRGKIIIYEYA